MSGISSRKIYDDCYQNNRLNQGTAPGSYKVNPTQVQNSLCLAANGMNNSHGMWYGPEEQINIKSLSDIESHLKNLDLPDSRCLEGRTMVEKNLYANYLSKSMKSNKTMCSRNLEQGNTRLEGSVSDVKMMNQSRFDFPIQDPRSSVYFGITGTEQTDSNRFGINTRLQAKDMKPADYQNKLNNTKV
jgi:hypothetical protein